MGFAKDGYYSFEHEGRHDGLVRVSGDGTVFEFARDGEWQQDPSLAGRFVDPDNLERVDDKTAAALALRYGVEL